MSLVLRSRLRLMLGFKVVVDKLSLISELYVQVVWWFFVR